MPETMTILHRLPVPGSARMVAIAAFSSRQRTPHEAALQSRATCRLAGA